MGQENSRRSQFNDSKKIVLWTHNGNFEAEWKLQYPFFDRFLAWRK